MITAILLAAGQSKRLRGENKLTKLFKGKPLINHILKSLIKSKVNRIIIEFVKHFTKQVKVYSKSSGIEEFDQLKKLVSEKYDLLIEPTKDFIAEFNADLESYNRLTWVFKNNMNDNIILLDLERTFLKNYPKFMFLSRVYYLSAEESKIYKEKSGSTVIKTDDL